MLIWLPLEHTIRDVLQYLKSKMNVGGLATIVATTGANSSSRGINIHCLYIITPTWIKGTMELQNKDLFLHDDEQIGYQLISGYAQYVLCLCMRLV